MRWRRKMNPLTRSVFGAVVAAGVAPGCTPPSTDAATQEPPKKIEFAEDAAPKTIAAADVKFDAERSLKYLKQLCDIGPRISGSEGMKKQQEILRKHFKDLGA